MELAKLAELVYNYTMAWGKKNGFKNTRSPSEKQLKWKAFFESHSSYDVNFHIALVEEITGEDLDFLKSGDTSKHVKYAFGVVIVPKGNHNSHDYTMGKPIVCTIPTNSYFVNKDGTTGNHMDKTLASVSLPTLEQVEEVLQGIKKNNKSFYAKLESFIEEKYEKTLRISPVPETAS